MQILIIFLGDFAFFPALIQKCIDLNVKADSQDIKFQLTFASNDEFYEILNSKLVCFLLYKHFY